MATYVPLTSSPDLRGSRFLTSGFCWKRCALPASRSDSGTRFVQCVFRESPYRSAGQSLVQKARTQTCAPKSRVRGRHPRGADAAVPCLPNLARQSEERREITQQQRWSQWHTQTVMREAAAGPRKPAAPPKSLMMTTLSLASWRGLAPQSWRRAAKNAGFAGG